MFTFQYQYHQIDPTWKENQKALDSSDEETDPGTVLKAEKHLNAD